MHVIWTCLGALVYSVWVTPTVMWFSACLHVTLVCVSVIWYVLHPAVPTAMFCSFILWQTGEGFFWERLLDISQALLVGSAMSSFHHCRDGGWLVVGWASWANHRAAWATPPPSCWNMLNTLDDFRNIWLAGFKARLTIVNNNGVQKSTACPRWNQNRWNKGTKSHNKWASNLKVYTDNTLYVHIDLITVIQCFHVLTCFFFPGY